jgi:hypothetical protein
MPLGETQKTDAITLRFIPRGTEYRLSEEKPKIGDTMRREGDEWVVVDVREDAHGNTVVTLRRVSGAAA